MLKENQISDLINQSGRLRMLSHRASMMLSQISAGVSDPWFKEELAISIDKFEKNYDHVVSIVNSEPFTKQRFSELITKSIDGKKSINEVVSQFLNAIKQHQSAIKSRNLASPEQLSSFCRFVASDLLVSLNNIVSFFENMLNEIATEKLKNIDYLAKNVESSIDEVDQINLSIKILSFNASVEAARAGDVGKGFAVVSKEMNTLSANTRKVTQDIKNTIKSFVEQLNN